MREPPRPNSQSRRRALLAGAVLVLILSVVSAVVGYGALPGGRSANYGVVTIDLPYDEPPVVPPGPHRAEFTAYCRLCHSTQLVLSQPRFPEKKWTEVIRKMVTVYGAQIPADQEPAILAYLMTVRGPEVGSK